MAMKRSLFIGGIALTVVLLILGIRWALQPKPIVFSDQAEDWLDRAPDGGITVDVQEATRGRGEYNDVNQQLLLPGAEPSAFAYEGVYKGEFFTTYYIDPGTSRILMQVTPNMKPNDGILQGFMVERYANGVLETHIFIDEDWRKALGDTINVVWGAEYAQSKPFAFEEVRDGIYHDFVLDDMSRLQPEISVGGVQVGNMKPGGIDPEQAAGIIMMAIH